MCEVFEKYAKEYAKECAKEYARIAFQNGVSLENVSIMLTPISEEEMLAIYEEVCGLEKCGA